MRSIYTLIALMPILRLMGTRLTLAARAGLPIRAGAEFRSGIRRPHWVYGSSIPLHISYLVGLWPLERISHLSTRRRIMATKRICLLLAALLSLSGVLPAAATDYEASDYLPLAVGNSWTYSHDYYDLHLDLGALGGESALYPTYYWAPLTEFHLPKFTITVRGTEVINGKTYYVLSDMPDKWPPAPPYFIAGKKLRWEGTHLMERTADGEQALFRFDGANEAGYTISTDERDDVFKVTIRSTLLRSSVPKYVFDYHDFVAEGGGGTFLAGYGIDLFFQAIAGTDHPILLNRIEAIRAVLGGVTVEYEDALIPTASSSSSWGQVKQSWLAGERRDP